MNKILAALLGLSVLANVVLGFMWYGQKTMVREAEAKYKQSGSEIAKLKNEVKEKEQLLKDFQLNKDYYEIAHSEELKSFVNDTFTTLFNYDNKTYVARFDKVRNRLSESVVSKLGSSGQTENTQIEFKNKVKAMEVYLTAVKKDTAKSLVNLETEYSIGTSKFPRKNQMFEVTVIRDGDKWVINKLEFMGAFEPFEGH